MPHSNKGSPVQNPADFEPYFFSLTSLMSGFIIFSVLGHISVMVGQDITELATQGPELVFVAYPQALSEMMPPALWSTMFFFCLFVLGIDSVFSSVECCNNALEDILHNQGIKGKDLADNHNLFTYTYCYGYIGQHFSNTKRVHRFGCLCSSILLGDTKCFRWRNLFLQANGLVYMCSVACNLGCCRSCCRFMDLRFN